MASPKRSVLLKDYLRDDLSSCSSSGFRSFPRRQCCTTVGFLVEKDLKVERKRRKKTVPRPRPMSVLQRASGAVMNAIKSHKSGVSSVLCRSLSRKVVSRRIQFWRKVAREDENKVVPRKRRSFRELMMLDKEHNKATSLTTTTSWGCESWGDSEFTFASTAASSSSGSSNDNYLPAQVTKEDHKIQQQLVAKEYWTNDEKEQLSPVSTLDCPFEDEEDIYKSHINSTSIILSFSQGSKHKHMHMHKRCHLLEPVVLENRFARLELEDELPHNHYSRNLRRDKNHNIEENARNLLNLVKRSIKPNSLITKAENNLLFDFFKQSIGENKENIDDSKKLKLCKVAEDWVHGKPQEQYLGWEVQGGRSVYIREMYKCEEWKKNADKETQQLGQDMADEIFTNLVNEFVLELKTSASH